MALGKMLEQWDFELNLMDSSEGIIDLEVRRALEEYQGAVNRYNSMDLTNPQIENVYFLERQVAFIRLQLALAKARMREGLEPALDYTSINNFLKIC